MCELRSGPIRQPVPDQQCTARLRAVMETLSDAHPMDFDQGVRDAFDSVTWFAQAVPGRGPLLGAAGLEESAQRTVVLVEQQ
jgi:hypothetical protein